MSLKIVKSLSYSVIERLALVGTQVLSLGIVARVLGPDVYGVIGVVASVFVFFNILNIAIENILFKEHVKYAVNNVGVLTDFFIFAVLKVILLLVFYSIVFFLLDVDKPTLFYIIVSFVSIQIAEMLSSVFTVHLSTQYMHKRIAYLSFQRIIVSFLALIPMFYFPTVEYLAIKEVVISLFFIVQWYRREEIVKRVFENLKEVRLNKDLFRFYYITLKDFSLWSHLNGVVTFFIYKADVFFLSIYTRDSYTLGLYAISVTLANFANIIPMVLNNHNVVALSNSKGKNEELKVDRLFLILYLFVIISSILGFLLLGDFLVVMVSGLDNKEVVTWTMQIIIGLLIMKGIGGIYLAKSIIYTSLSKMFLYVSLPSLVVCMATYALSSKFYGAQGLAVANIFIGMVWALFLFLFYRASKYASK